MSICLAPSIALDTSLQLNWILTTTLLGWKLREIKSLAQDHTDNQQWQWNLKLYCFWFQSYAFSAMPALRKKTEFDNLFVCEDVCTSSPASEKNSDAWNNKAFTRRHMSQPRTPLYTLILRLRWLRSNIQVLWSLPSGQGLCLVHLCISLINTEPSCWANAWWMNKRHPRPLLWRQLASLGLL